MPIAREGWLLILVPLGLGVALFLLRWPWTGGALLLLGLFTAFFFRDPDRAVPADPRLALSPAAGKVIVAAPASPRRTPAGGGPQAWGFALLFEVPSPPAPNGGRSNPPREPPQPPSPARP